jgi:hypothetical protein
MYWSPTIGLTDQMQLRIITLLFVKYVAETRNASRIYAFIALGSGVIGSEHWVVERLHLAPYRRS